ncbi:MAG TPA: apolipoprotein N-acyltransferase [Allosphingosinicella sp.]|nr:apolipoprotein N-acyltransferase [Allosphingosinicella sp.]
MKFLAFSLLAGLVSALGFAPFGLWPLTLLGFAGLLWLVEAAPSLRAALARGWWFGVGQFAVGLNWIATAFTFQAAMPAWLGWIAVVLLSVYLAVYPAAAAGLAWRWGRGSAPALALVLAAAWIVTEWLRATLFTGFAWNPAGVVAIDMLGLAGLARYVGTYGLSGAIALAGGILFLLARRQWRAAAALAVPMLAAAIVLRPGPPAAASGPLVRIVQPNIGQEEKWTPTFAARNEARLGRLSRGGDPAAILIWPEAAVTDPLQDGRRFPEVREEVMATRGAVRRLILGHPLLLAGGLTIKSADGRFANGATNSVFALTPQRILARYDKAHLVPYGEYLPMRPLLSAIGLSRLAPGDLDFDPGPGPRTIALPHAGRVGFQLCYEIIFSGQVVDRDDRPDWIFNPSNDAWFGAWGPPQHLAQARLRALEEGLPIVRATPTGISALIDADGRLTAHLPPGTAGAIEARLPRPLPPTLFARFGNPLAFAFALLLAAAAIAVRRKAR